MSGESWNDVLDGGTRSGMTANGLDKAARLAPAEAEAALPACGDPYQAAGMPGDYPLTRLVCIMGREGFQKGGQAYRFFQYVHLDSDTDLGFTEQGQVITLRFCGSKTVQVKVSGRNLLRVCDEIHQHLIPWIRVVDRDFRGGSGAAGNAPVITGIAIQEVE